MTRNQPAQPSLEEMLQSNTNTLRVVVALMCVIGLMGGFIWSTDHQQLNENTLKIATMEIANATRDATQKAIDDRLKVVEAQLCRKLAESDRDNGTPYPQPPRMKYEPLQPDNTNWKKKVRNKNKKLIV